MKHSCDGHFLLFTFRLFSHEFKKPNMVIESNLECQKTLFDLNKKCWIICRLLCFQEDKRFTNKENKNKTNTTLLFPGRQELNLKAWIKQIFKIIPFLFAGGQEHPEQVQRGGGEEIAHSGGAGIRLCIWNHFQLRRICICMYLHVFACTSRCIWNHFELSRTCICS